MAAWAKVQVSELVADTVFLEWREFHLHDSVRVSDIEGIRYRTRKVGQNIGQGTVNSDAQIERSLKIISIISDIQ